MKFTAFLLIVSAAAFSQSSATMVSGTSTRNAAGVVSGSASFGPARFMPPAVLNAPYSGEEIQEHQQTLADGTHINQLNSRRMMYRDSQGRTRVERPMFPGLDRNGNGPQSPTVVEISDPVAGVQYTLDTTNKVAHRAIVQAPPTAAGRAVPARAAVPPAAPVPAVAGSGAGGVAWVQGPNGARQSIATEKLGTQTIDGLTVEGQRITRTIPANSEGNDRDFHTVSESWTAPDLHMVIYSKNSDPRSGDNITRFANLSRNDPDPGLFLPPGDYQIVDETGSFTIRFGQ